MKIIKPILMGVAILLGVTSSAQTLLPYPTDTIKGQVYYRYTVPKGIGIYRIAVNFGVTQEDILQANPQLLTQGMRYDDIILIPAKITIASQFSEETTIQSEEIPSDTTQALAITDTKHPKTKRNRNVIKRPKLGIKDRKTINIDTIPTHRDTIFQHTFSEETTTITDSIIVDSTENVIRLAMMLPLQTQALKRDKNIDRFVDFYAGALLAINEVQKEGQKIELYTYDVDKDATVTHLLMQDSTWPSVDAIIGPAYPQQVSAATQYAKRDSTWILIPFTSNLLDIEDNPYILKFNPSSQTSAKALGEYIATLGDQVNCVLIEAKESETIPTSIGQIHKALKDHKIPSTYATLRQIYTDSIDSVFVAEKENIIIFNTENYNNIQSLIPHLEKASEQFDITLYSQFSWGGKNIPIPQIYTSAFDEILAIPEHYNIEYMKYFGHELSSTHPRYDLLGYDLTLQLLHILQQDIETDSSSLPIESMWMGTQTNILYKKISPTGGFENQTIHIIRK